MKSSWPLGVDGRCRFVQVGGIFVKLFYLILLSSVLVTVSVFMALSTVFHSINSPDYSPFSDSVLPVLSLPDWWSLTVYLFMKASFSPEVIIPSG